MIRSNQKLQEEIIKRITKCLNGKSFQALAIGSPIYMHRPKSKPFDYRRCALLDPIDAMKYLALTLMAAEKIESSRIPPNRRRVFSYRFKPQGQNIFNQKLTYQAFQKRHSQKLNASKTPIIVYCDIANFYDRLNLHRLESVLHSIDIEPWLINTINELLFFWSNRDSYGLPVGGNASRILAEAALIEVDNFLLARDVDFIRFVDDYRLFAPNIEIAHHWLVLLMERLSMEGLSINSGKTSIVDGAELKKEREEETTGPVRIIAGYGGSIPTKFRQPSSREKERLGDIDVDDAIEKAAEQTIITADQMKDLIKAIAYQERYEDIPRLIRLLKRYPQFLLFFVDMLIKNASEIPANLKNKTRDLLSNWFKKLELQPEFLSISFAKILTDDNYLDKDIVINYFRNMRRNAGAYVGRVVIEKLIPHLSRGEVLELRNYYDRANDWERRAIIHMVNERLPDTEKRPWLKNVKNRERKNLLSIEIFEKFGEKKKSKRSRKR